MKFLTNLFTVEVEERQRPVQAATEAKAQELEAAAQALRSEVEDLKAAATALYGESARRHDLEAERKGDRLTRQAVEKRQRATELEEKAKSFRSSLAYIVDPATQQRITALEAEKAQARQRKAEEAAEAHKALLVVANHFARWHQAAFDRIDAEQEQARLEKRDSNVFSVPTMVFADFVRNVAQCGENGKYLDLDLPAMRRRGEI